MKRKFTFGGRKLEHKSRRNWAIAKLVRSVEFEKDATAGYCYPRALVGSEILNRWGIPHKIVLGSLLYRAGTEPYDIVAFCGEDNRGHHPGKWHCWIENGEDLIDFSAGDWRKLIDECPLELNPLNHPPVNWTFPPPEYIWQKRELLVSAWEPAPNGPPPGCAWYGPIAEHNQEMLEQARSELMPHIESAVDKVFLKWGLPVVRFVDKKEGDPDVQIVVIPKGERP
jgi:hypothetical protein